MIRTNEFFRPDLLDGIPAAQAFALGLLLSFFVWKAWGLLTRKRRIQTSLGELIKAKAASAEIQKRAFASITSKRLDFGIVDRSGFLVVAIEYQGSGHYHATSFMRDAVKREALRKAGVQLMEIRKDYSPKMVRSQILGYLSPG